MITWALDRAQVAVWAVSLVVCCVTLGCTVAAARMAAAGIERIGGS